jgi:hypothetical protein
MKPPSEKAGLDKLNIVTSSVAAAVSEAAEGTAGDADTGADVGAGGELSILRAHPARKTKTESKRNTTRNLVLNIISLCSRQARFHGDENSISRWMFRILINVSSLNRSNYV